MATAAHPLADARELVNPNVVKVVLDHAGHALYFSRSPVPYARDAFARGIRSIPRGLPVYRHLGIYAYRAGFLRRFTRLAPAAVEPSSLNCLPSCLSSISAKKLSLT